jgi:hypothetical protein
VTSDANGANGVFCYGGNGGTNGAAGDGTTVIIRDTVIRTSGDGSGGIMTTGGGITYAYDLSVTTGGRSSAAIRSDRGGGQVYIDGGSYVTNGLGSPVIYSTAEIHAANATLVSNLSEGVCIEGLNSVELTDCDLTANNTATNGNATFLDSIMIYQSMSGDAASGTSSFTMTGGRLTSKSGHIFHVTNTSAIISLNGVTLVNEDSENILLSVCDDGWNGGSNTATLNAKAQRLTGAILVGDNSALTLNLSEGSSFEGRIDGNITNAKGATVSTGVGTVSVTLGADERVPGQAPELGISERSGREKDQIKIRYEIRLIREIPKEGRAVPVVRYDPAFDKLRQPRPEKIFIARDKMPEQQYAEYARRQQPNAGAFAFKAAHAFRRGPFSRHISSFIPLLFGSSLAQEAAQINFGGAKKSGCVE